MSKGGRQRGQWYVLTALGGAGVIVERGAGAGGGPGRVAHVECYEDAVEIVRWWTARLTNPQGGDADERRRDDSSPAVHQPYVATPAGSADEQGGSVGGEHRHLRRRRGGVVSKEENDFMREEPNWISLIVRLNYGDLPDYIQRDVSREEFHSLQSQALDDARLLRTARE